MRLRPILLCVAFALTATTATAQDFCTALDNLAASKADFSDLRGERIDDDSWQSTLTIPAFDACTLRTYEDGLTFNCATAFETDDALYAAHAAAAEAIWSCDASNTRSYFESKGDYASRTWTFFYGDAQFSVGAGQDFMTNDPQMSFMAFEG